MASEAMRALCPPADETSWAFVPMVPPPAARLAGGSGLTALDWGMRVEVAWEAVLGETF